MATFLPPHAISHPIRPAPLLTRALAGLEPLSDEERPFADIASLLQRRSRAGSGPVSAIRLEIANLDDIAALAGSRAARHASDTVARRLLAGAGPHRMERLHERRFLIAAALPLEAAIDFTRQVIGALARPIIFDKVRIQIAIAATIGGRHGVAPRLALAA